MGKWGGILPTSRLLLLAVVAAATCIGAPVRAEKRVALVIGNDRYANLPAERQLQKAVNDAEAVGDTLARLGFEVIRGRNLGRQGIIDKLELTAKLAPGDTAAFFYAGHGVAIGGVNYLVPSDAPLVTPDAEARVRGASVSEPDLIAEIQSKSPRVAFLAIDACRDNPFPRSGGRSIGQTRGLAEAKPVRGVFTVYSAGIGQTALDRLEPNDPDRNSVFSRVFVEQLARPGLDLSSLAVEVRERVAELALKAKNDFGQAEPHEQTPAYYDQTVGERVYLAGLPSAAPPAGASPPRTAPPPPSRPDTPTATPDPGRSTSSAAAAFWQAKQVGPAAPTRHARTRSREHSRPRWRKNTSRQVVPGRRRSRPSPPIRRSSRTFRVLTGVSEGILNVRSGPGTGYSLMIAIPAGAADVVVGRCRMPDDGGRNPWREVQWRGHIGWASGCCMVDVRTGAFPRAGE